MNPFDISFWTATPWWVLLIIFAAKAVEVSVSTLRIILIQRGFRKIGSILGFFEVLMWIIIAGNVIRDLTSVPIKGLVYALGFSAGIFCGSLIEAKLAFGKVLVQIITSPSTATDILNIVRSRKYGVTEIEGRGFQSARKILMIYVERSQANELVSSIRRLDTRAVVSVIDIHALTGGFLPKRQRYILK